MLTTIYYHLTTFFRENYISSLRRYVVKVDPTELTEEYHLDTLTDWDSKITFPSVEHVKKVYLYLVSFPEQLTIREAKAALSKIGFEPATFLETVMFYHKYKNSIEKYSPIISIEAYNDREGKFGLKYNDLYTLCMNRFSGNKPFERVCELEAMEAYGGYCFRAGAYFLSKPI